MHNIHNNGFEVYVIHKYKEAKNSIILFYNSTVVYINELSFNRSI